MKKFHFPVDEKFEAYCEEIILIMKQQFGLSEFEAIKQMNEQWKNLIIEPVNLIYHELPEYWAERIYHQSSKQNVTDC